MSSSDLKFNNVSGELVTAFLIRYCPKEIIAHKQFMDLNETLESLGIDPYERYDLQGAINDRVEEKLEALLKDHTTLGPEFSEIGDFVRDDFDQPDVKEYLYQELIKSRKKRSRTIE